MKKFSTFLTVQDKKAKSHAQPAAKYSLNLANLLYSFAAEDFKTKNDHTCASESIKLAEEVKNQVTSLEVSDNPPLDFSRERIISPPSNLNLEHHVASFITTTAVQVFQEVKDDAGRHQWVFTPEQRDEESKKIPDLIVEQVVQTRNGLISIPWLFMEFKKKGGDPSYKALSQLVNAVKGKLKDETAVLTIYLVVVVGTKVSFWEIDFEELGDYRSEEEVESLWGCRSLMQTAVKYVDDQEEPPYTTGRGNIPKGVTTILNRRKVKIFNPLRSQAVELFNSRHSRFF